MKLDLILSIPLFLSTDGGKVRPKMLHLNLA
jgi:hypothetical protein